MPEPATADRRRGPEARPSRVLAIGVDAAEATVVRKLVAAGELPALGRLLGEGRWLDIETPAVGSGAVWPTFFTGTRPEQHGIYAGWAWQPSKMGVAQVDIGGLDPFWRRLDQAGRTTGTIDVPFAPHVGVARGFEVTEWGPHDILADRMSVSPPAFASEMGRQLKARHPLRKRRINPEQPGRPDEMHRLAQVCHDGCAMRGDLGTGVLAHADPEFGLVVFGEVHHAAHELWHTLEPDHPLFADLPPAPPHLLEVFRSVDRQIDRLVASVPPETAVAVFSLHGMRAVRGVVSLLQPVLEATGWACPAGTGEDGAGGAGAGSSTPSVDCGDLARRALARVKRHSPPALRHTYHRLVPRSVNFRLAGPGMVPRLDWSRTRAFALPTDQLGWLRVNLAGRERDGIVAPADYDAVLAELEAMLVALVDLEGRPLVAGVARPGPDHATLLPDLVVHWTEAACARPVRVAGLGVEAIPIAARMTGQHTYQGFCVARGLGERVGGTLKAEDLHRTLSAAVVA